MAINVDQIKFRLELLRGMKRDVYSHIPINSLLWHMFDHMEQSHGYDGDTWEGFSFGELKQLKKDLDELIEDLHEQQTVSDKDKFLLDLECDETNEMSIAVVSKQPETIGAWKQRLKKLRTMYHFDPVKVAMVQEVLEKLYDRTKHKELSGQINPNIINSD